ncbi:hypothetical protein GUJ93_ZPchr0007g3565 [Zizania palustris]|uniref:Uncharacterized protein n=1 Tax=Zizania palustris TaxID=103762 RepID=A0A8J5THF8_ZIZPA|nr:hypothetical protein GUJ93_ZPchr0007g3565 [Zizania palustris]
MATAITENASTGRISVGIVGVAAGVVEERREKTRFLLEGEFPFFMISFLEGEVEKEPKFARAGDDIPWGVGGGSREVYAAREKVGVYIPKDDYQQEENEQKDMADQIERMTASLEVNQK